MSKKIIIVASSILLVVLGVLVSLMRSGTEIVPNQAPTPTVVATPYPNIPEAIVSPLVTDLPYQTEQFLVEYLPKSDKFFVTIFNGESQTSYQAALNYLKARGIPNPENNLKVRFVYLKSPGRP